MSAINDNRSVLKPIDGIQYHKIAGEVLDQAVSCSKYLTGEYDDPNALIIAINGILDEVRLKPDNANVFEESFKVIARFLGFSSQRPEQEFKKGPDVLWGLGGLRYLVIECKSEATTATISKDYANQLNGSGIWFQTQYRDTCSFTPIMVHRAAIFEYAASPHQQTRIITEAKLEEFCESMRDFVKSVASNNELGNPPAIRNKLIAYKLRADDIVSNYTVPFTVRNTPNASLA